MQNLIVQFKTNYDFIAVDLLISLTILLVGSICRRRLNVSGWLEKGFVLYVLIFSVVAILLKFGLLKSDIFWGVFFATFLGFITSILIEKWQEEKENLRTQKQEVLNKQRAISLLRAEITANIDIARRIQDYFDKVASFGGSDFVNRTQDCFSLRFQTIARNSFWKLFGRSGIETSSIEKISNFYTSLEYCNNLLNESSDYIRHRLRFGSIADDYKNAVTALPWGPQLRNELPRMIDDGEKISNLLPRS